MKVKRKNCETNHRFTETFEKIGRELTIQKRGAAKFTGNRIVFSNFEYILAKQRPKAI